MSGKSRKNRRGARRSYADTLAENPPCRRGESDHSKFLNLLDSLSRDHTKERGKPA